jgi:hypothetical protein
LKRSRDSYYAHNDAYTKVLNDDIYVNPASLSESYLLVKACKSAQFQTFKINFTRLQFQHFV